MFSLYLLLRYSADCMSMHSSDRPGGRIGLQSDTKLLIICSVAKYTVQNFAKKESRQHLVHRTLKI